MITLYIGRHGETDLNSENKLRGWKDEPLNKEGVKEAHKMATLMKGYPIDKVFCSDLDRADHTAQIVAEAHGLKATPKHAFRPLDYGNLNGKPLKEIQPILDQLNEIWETEPDHEAPGGESFEEFQDRNLDGLAAVIGRSRDAESIMLVAHLRNALLFHAVAENGGPLSGETVMAMAGKDWHQESGAVSHFEWDGKLNFIGLLSGSDKPKAAVS